MKNGSQMQKYNTWGMTAVYSIAYAAVWHDHIRCIFYHGHDAGVIASKPSLFARHSLL